MTECVRTRFLLLSDTHSALPHPELQPDYPFSQPFPNADVAIHTGDLTSTGKPQEHERALELLKSLPAPVKIVIPGNHDLTLDRDYCRNHPKLYGNWSPSEADLKFAHDLYTSEDAVAAGIVYLVEGVYSLALDNGARLVVYASAYTPEFMDWAFAYSRDEDRFNSSPQCQPVNPVPSYDVGGGGSVANENQVTVVLTHGPPMRILDQTRTGQYVGCEHLRTAVERCRPILHCFGHIHEGWGSVQYTWDWKKIVPTSAYGRQQEAIDRVAIKNAQYIDGTNVEHGKETIFVNASIMDVQYNPIQKPWLVDLMLPNVSQAS